MPHYDYRCEQGHETTVEQRITDEPLRTCLQITFHGLCGGKLKRLVSRTSFLLKGAGWAADNYSPRGTDPTRARSGSEEG